MIVNRLNEISEVTMEQKDITVFIQAIRTDYNSLKNDHLIINLMNVQSLTSDDILKLGPLSIEHKTLNKSFVIVTEDVNYDEIPDELVVVPTVQEAHDMIEMEAIERDLGF